MSLKGNAGAYLVSRWRRWKLRTYFTEGGLDDYLKHCDLVKIVTLERFVAYSKSGAPTGAKVNLIGAAPDRRRGSSPPPMSLMSLSSHCPASERLRR
jgi:hypothetical protein